MSVSSDRAMLLRHAGLWTLGLTTLSGAISQPLFGHEMSLGIALGALLGWVNLWVLSRTLRAVLSSPEEHRPARQQKWVLPGVFLLKWPFLLLALAGILWYMPARPEGVAFGALLSLVGASIAALRSGRGHGDAPPTP